jgi:hypothetical protein
MNAFSLCEVTWLGRYGVGYHADDHLIVHRRNRVYKTIGKGEPLVEIGRIPITILEKILIVFRLGLRFKRLVFYNIFPVSGSCYFVNFANRIGYIENGTYTEINGIINPCKILNNGAAVDDNGDVYFGEYFLNSEREKPVQIYKFEVASKKLEIVHVFPAGAVRHVHGIYKDPYTGYFYIATGDRDLECAIFYTKDKFTSLQMMGAGDETWRTVSILFTQDHIYYGMDAEFIPNRVFCVDKNTGFRTDLGQIPGPVYYSAILKGKPVFIVAAELCPSQQNSAASVVGVCDGKAVVKVSFDKDLSASKKITRFFGKIFLPGNFHLPFHNSKSTNRLFLYGIALSKVDGKCFEITNIGN